MRPAGLEPATSGLRDPCSTIELRTQSIKLLKVWCCGPALIVWPAAWVRSGCLSQHPPPGTMPGVEPGAMPACIAKHKPVRWEPLSACSNAQACAFCLSMLVNSYRAYSLLTSGSAAALISRVMIPRDTRIDGHLRPHRTVLEQGSKYHPITTGDGGWFYAVG